MLNLARRLGERLKITVPPSSEPVEIWLTLCKVRSMQQAMLGIEAPRNVGILREELLPKGAA